MVFAKKAWLPEGWAANVRLVIGENGSIEAINRDAHRCEGDEEIGVVIPSMANLHSHAFQRAMAGMAEFRAHQSDSFWSWRETMYTFARTIDLDAFKAIASQLYSEMLVAGYSGVAEFHYLHQLGDLGKSGDPSETAGALLQAARDSGIGMTLCPVLYQQGGFGKQPLAENQHRFQLDTDHYCSLLTSLWGQIRAEHGEGLGLAIHSLRAVSPEALREVLAFWETLNPRGPIHIHIAEQQAEVEACKQWCGKRPVRWLLDEIGVDSRWCLVHATHLSEDEVRDLAQSGAVVGLCPTTEANLGDGFFELLPFQSNGGKWGIGSDSHISVSPVEELRWLEYGQRLRFQRRNLVASAQEPHVGAQLWRRALEGGHCAMGRSLWGLKVGARADLVELDIDHPLLWGCQDDGLIDAFLFAGNQPLVKGHMVGGRWMVRNGCHIQGTQFSEAYRQAQSRLKKHHLGGRA